MLIYGLAERHIGRGENADARIFALQDVAEVRRGGSAPSGDGTLPHAECTAPVEALARAIRCGTYQMKSLKKEIKRKQEHGF